MRIAHEVATRSTCPRSPWGRDRPRQTHPDHRLQRQPFRDAPLRRRRMPHQDRGRPESCQRTLHAEQNAIIQAAYHGVSVTGASIYCTHQPCLMCVKMIMNAGIEEVHYAGGYPDPLAWSSPPKAASPWSGSQGRTGGSRTATPTNRPTLQRPTQIPPAYGRPPRSPGAMAGARDARKRPAGNARS